eukprot:jgi/Psemu1/6500/gm1.6500_g
MTKRPRGRSATPPVMCEAAGMRDSSSSNWALQEPPQLFLHSTGRNSNPTEDSSIELQPRRRSRSRSRRHPTNSLTLAAACNRSRQQKRLRPRHIKFYIISLTVSPWPTLLGPQIHPTPDG